MVQRRFVAGGYDQTTAWGYTEYGQLKTLTPPGQLTATTLEYNADGLNTGRYAPGLAFTTGFSGVHAPSGMSYGVPARIRVDSRNAGQRGTTAVGECP